MKYALPFILSLLMVEMLSFAPSPEANSGPTVRLCRLGETVDEELRYYKDQCELRLPRIVALVDYVHTNKVRFGELVYRIEVSANASIRTMHEIIETCNVALATHSEDDISRVRALIELNSWIHDLLRHQAEHEGGIIPKDTIPFEKKKL